MQSLDTQRQLFDAILKRRLDARRNSNARDCPDEATLAAYCDRSLPAPQSTALEEHFSNCARCQGMLAAVARMRAAQEKAAAGHMARQRWALYAALAAAVAGISIAVGLMRSGRNPAPSGAQFSAKQSGAPAQVASKPQAEERKANPQIALNEAVKQAPESYSAGIAQAPSPPPSTGESLAPGNFASEEEQPRYAKQEGGFSAHSRSAMPRNPGLAGSPERRALLKAAPQGEIAAREAAGEPVRAAPAGPTMAAGALAPAPMAAPMGGYGSAAQMISLRTADNVERWRLGANGTIQHRESDGSWHEQNSGVTSALRAGAAPSPTTCWIVGSGGTILRTTDGEHWQRIDSPTGADLVAVFATDASDATVTADDGRRFATSDAGRTWRPL